MHSTALKFSSIFCILGGLLSCSSGSEALDSAALPKTPAEATPLVSTPQKNVQQVKAFHVHEAFGVGKDVYVRSLAIDKAEQAIWIGTSVGLLYIDLLSRDVRDVFTRTAGLANEYIFSAFVDKTGVSWFGTNGGGLTAYKKGEWDTFFPMHGLADYWVYSITEQSDGTLWIGTWAGVNRLDAARENFETYVEELVNEWVYGIDVDAQDRVWLGTEGGVSMYDGETWHAWTNKEGMGAANEADLPTNINTGLGTRSRHDLGILTEGRETYNPNYVFCLMVADSGDVWVGTWGGGVSRYDGKKWHNYTVQDGLASNVVFSMDQDADGNYWFGTNQGLSYYDGENWQTYQSKDGLMGNSIYAVQATPSGEIWVGSRTGVARLARGKPAETKQKKQ